MTRFHQTLGLTFFATLLAVIPPALLGKYVFRRDVDCGYPPVPGPCENFTDKVYYESHEARCKYFRYGGCGGNTNFFHDMDSCRKACNGSLATPYETTPRPTMATTLYPGLDPICDLGLEKGQCRPGDSASVRFHYDIQTGFCKQFIFCSFGNENNFKSFEECESRCITGEKQTSLNTRPPVELTTVTRPLTSSTTPFPLYNYKRTNELNCHDATAIRVYIFTWVGECALTCDRYRPSCNAISYNKQTLFCKLLTHCDDPNESYEEVDQPSTTTPQFLFGSNNYNRDSNNGLVDQDSDGTEYWTRWKSESFI